MKILTRDDTEHDVEYVTLADAMQEIQTLREYEADKMRIDWLQDHHETVWKAQHEEYVDATDNHYRRFKQTVFDGWCVYPDCIPRPTIREAIDVAISLENAGLSHGDESER